MDPMDVDAPTATATATAAVLLDAPAKYAKQPAALCLLRPLAASASSSLQVTITPSSTSTSTLDPVVIPFDDIANLQQVPGKPTLKFILISRPAFSPIVHLTHPSEALTHTQTITEAVTSFLALRISKAGGKPASSFASASASASGSAPASRSSSRSATPAPAGTSRAASPSSSATVTPASAASLVQQLTNLSLRDELELRAELLKKHRTLAKLHQDLVRSRHVTENEFWAARKPLLERAALEKAQKPGHKSTRPPDVGRQTGDNKVTFTVTPQLVHSIFLQYPSVHRLFMQKVPVEMSEKDFWQRYVQSSLFKQSPATVAELATSGEQIAGSRAGPSLGSGAESGKATEGDAMFDACFSEEVQRLREEMAADIVRPTLNLTATEEDRVDINGNMPDKMMRFTEEASILKKFNQHSSRILHSVMYVHVISPQIWPHCSSILPNVSPLQQTQARQPAQHLISRNIRSPNGRPGARARRHPHSTRPRLARGLATCRSPQHLGR
ncbi:hypothetical protein BCR44DRAFT_167600 [Catenaria anguillulae PL171]|uniref:BSD domain-containing protein n=1 Tax=Catenaria anguillulae PL171 TaxID=765915 RepID=A0A1Y2HAL9_9FUNG|nr:hypothetical protein BCR44DRAFT_167600 [Catenaria anguillulae PL171]